MLSRAERRMRGCNSRSAALPPDLKAKRDAGGLELQYSAEGRRTLARDAEQSISFGAIEQPAIPTPEQLLSDLCTPYLVKNFISDMLRADCVKAANILEVVAQSFAARADRILKGSK